MMYPAFANRCAPYIYTSIEKSERKIHVPFTRVTKNTFVTYAHGRHMSLRIGEEICLYRLRPNDNIPMKVRGKLLGETWL